MSIEVIEHDGTRYAEIIWADARVEKTTFFSPPESSFQFGLLAHEAGYQEEPHYHKATSRARSTTSSRCSSCSAASSTSSSSTTTATSCARCALGAGRRDRAHPRRARDPGRRGLPGALASSRARSSATRRTRSSSRPRPPHDPGLRALHRRGGGRGGRRGGAARRDLRLVRRGDPGVRARVRRLRRRASTASRCTQRHDRAAARGRRRSGSGRATRCSSAPAPTSPPRSPPTTTAPCRSRSTPSPRPGTSTSTSSRG